MTELEQAIEMLKVQYKKAQKDRMIYRPIANALYTVWKAFDDPLFDREAGERGGEDADT